MFARVKILHPTQPSGVYVVVIVGDFIVFHIRARRKCCFGVMRWASFRDARLGERLRALAEGIRKAHEIGDGGWNGAIFVCFDIALVVFVSKCGSEEK